MRAFCLLLLAACGGASARDPCASLVDLQWGTEQDDEALTLIPARGGGVYVGGYGGGTLGVSDLGPVGNSLGLVRKLSASGEMQCERPLDTAATDIVETLVKRRTGTSMLPAGPRANSLAQPRPASSTHSRPCLRRVGR